MNRQTFVYRSRIPASAEDVFRWHTRSGALERLSPPWQPVEVIERKGGVYDGARVVLRLRVGALPQRWVAEHCDYQDGRQFRDVQVSGPFARWEHTHRVEPDGPAACFLEDHLEYALPAGMVGNAVGGAFVRQQLVRLFSYRHTVTTHDIAQHGKWKGGRPMRILVSGASGLVGSALVPFLTTGGHHVARLVRGQPRLGAAEVHWNPHTETVDAAGLKGMDAVVHLAGENIASGRWTTEKKARIRDSRVRGTRALCEALARLEQPPKVLVSASATGYYGDRGDEVLREESAPGTGFLADVCREWEAAAEPARQKGIRVIHLRFGVIFSPAGGALAKMLLPFRLGLGGVVGSGTQYMSWIALDDVIGAIHQAIITESLRGAVNTVAPHPVTNQEFTKTLGKVLRRPTVLPLPGFAARLAFGEMADQLLLASTRVEPARLIASGHTFRHPHLEAALRSLLGKP